MKRLLTLLLCALCSPAFAQREDIPHTPAHGAVVIAECQLNSGCFCTGSAVLLDPRHALAAYHCVKRPSMSIVLPYQTVEADVIAVHPRNDWALLRFRERLTGVPLMRMRPNALPIGSWVYGFGFGQGSFGITTGRYQGTHIDGGPTEFGDSGGPILDEQGALVGLATELDNGTENWRGHAIASDCFRSFCNLRFETFDNVRMVD